MLQVSYYLLFTIIKINIKLKSLLVKIVKKSSFTAYNYRRPGVSLVLLTFLQ